MDIHMELESMCPYDLPATELCMNLLMYSLLLDSKVLFFLSLILMTFYPVKRQFYLVKFVSMVYLSDEIIFGSKFGIWIWYIKLQMPVILSNESKVIQDIFDSVLFGWILVCYYWRKRVHMIACHRLLCGENFLYPYQDHL